MAEAILYFLDSAFIGQSAGSSKMDVQKYIIISSDYTPKSDNILIPASWTWPTAHLLTFALNQINMSLMADEDDASRSESL